MSISTHLPGRLRNTSLPKIHGLMPLFEAVVNSIHSIDELHLIKEQGEITVEIIRDTQISFQYDEEKVKRGAPTQENIQGFKIVDNGVGFNEINMNSFETLDSDYKAKLGARGVGRLLWLKAFEKVRIESAFVDQNDSLKCRTFAFTNTQGVVDVKLCDAEAETQRRTTVHLDGFKSDYREKTVKTGRAIANNLLEHCLWYFVREDGAPRIRVLDEQDVIDLNDMYKSYMLSFSKKENIFIKNIKLELTHLKLKASSAKSHFIAWCAGSRVVFEENLAGKVPGLHGKIKDETGEFIYGCYVTSPFLDERVRPERIGFDIEEVSSPLFMGMEPDMAAIRTEVVASSSRYLASYLQENVLAGRERVTHFVDHRAPRYRPILARIEEAKLSVDPTISDKELELFLHKQLSEIENSMLEEGHEMMNYGINESPAQYRARLDSYMSKVNDIKKSDLANYVFHRKVVLDILENALKLNESGKYLREEVIHSLIMPLKKTSNDILFEGSNLWLIEERLAFHHFLASDTPLSKMPILNSTDNNSPDLCVLNVFDEPLLVAEGQQPPLASIIIIEIKRPMRDDAAAGSKKDPVEQALDYLVRIRKGGVKTYDGRLIPSSPDVPGFCYVICDITDSMKLRCAVLDLSVTSDYMGYFGYNKNFKTYIEVISYDRLIKAAKDRNRAFFDKLGLPST